MFYNLNFKMFYGSIEIVSSEEKKKTNIKHICRSTSKVSSHLLCRRFIMILCMLVKNGQDLHTFIRISKKRKKKKTKVTPGA